MAKEKKKSKTKKNEEKKITSRIYRFATRVEDDNGNITLKTAWK